MPTLPPPPGLVALAAFALSAVVYELFGLWCLGTPGTLSAGVWWLCDRWPEASLLMTAAMILLFCHLILRLF